MDTRLCRSDSDDVSTLIRFLFGILVLFLCGGGFTGSCFGNENRSRVTAETKTGLPATQINEKLRSLAENYRFASPSPSCRLYRRGLPLLYPRILQSIDVFHRATRRNYLETLFWTKFSFFWISRIFAFTRPPATVPDTLGHPLTFHLGDVRFSVLTSSDKSTKTIFSNTFQSSIESQIMLLLC